MNPLLKMKDGCPMTGHDKETDLTYIDGKPYVRKTRGRRNQYYYNNFIDISNISKPSKFEMILDLFQVVKLFKILRFVVKK